MADHAARSAERRALLKPPPVLYHYCPPASLINILQSRRLWAGDARQMNDAQELHYVRKVAARVAVRLLKDPTSAAGKHGTQLLEAVADQSYRYWEWDRYFFVCFTENGDQLSQWRAYANDGLGYAIGLRSGAHWSTGFTRPVTLERVVYDEEEQDTLLEPLLREAVAEVDKTGGDDVFLRGFWEVLAIIKNPAFAEEKEWRLIVQDWRGDGSGPPFRFVSSRFGVSAKIEVGCVESSDQLTATSNSLEGDLSHAINLPLVHIVSGPRVSDESATFRLVEQCAHWARCETLQDAIGAETGVYMSVSTASYR
ncbi:MAG: DUF2971 domain-containing protein [Polyangiaceae bacterium]